MIELLKIYTSKKLTQIQWNWNYHVSASTLRPKNHPLPFLQLNFQTLLPQLVPKKYKIVHMYLASIKNALQAEAIQ